MTTLAALPRFPIRADRVPMITDWPHQATVDPDFAIPEPCWPLTGVLTGERAGIFVVDVDVKNGGQAWLAANLHQLPRTQVNFTPSGGMHLLYQCFAGVRGSQSKIGIGTDIVARPGSPQMFIWWPRRGYPVLNEGMLAEPGEWLVNEIRTGGEHCRPGSNPFPGGSARFPVWHIPNERTDNPIRRSTALAGVVENATRGTRTPTLYWVARRFGEMTAEGVITAGVAEGLLVGAAGRNSLIKDYGIEKIRKTIRQAIDESRR